LVCGNAFGAAEPFNVLRLVRCTQPRSNLVAFGGQYADAPRQNGNVSFPLVGTRQRLQQRLQAQARPAASPEFHALNSSSHWHRGFSLVIPGEREDGAVSTALAQHGKPLKRFDVVTCRLAPG
jgi:hypothetical protein